MTVLASRQTVEGSVQVARNLENQWRADDPNDPRLAQLGEIVKHLTGVTHSQPDQMLLFVVPVWIRASKAVATIVHRKSA